ncbi:serine/threonine-protein kinase [Dokdonella sp.]|uniref:serine/threonine-protein kinase n=1 Tax=Dokdonella sp. TaxID=2291710 RepID=UPI001B239443|nr:serine/threonine-protein kinase [Dokdonella sp.]MBO9664176.1 serine/threonine protein kinase [Dokdonella sp.]
MPSIRDLYESALVLPVAERDAWLAAHCADETLRRRVGAMLEASASTDPLARPLDQLAAALDADEAPVALPSGGRIGPFELLDVLGHGGFSTVYRGVRGVEGVAQEVAIKLLHRGLQTAASRRQFRREQRALAQLRHPNIARLIEGGVTDAGLPYIALELVGGERITEHVRRLRLDLRERLELFLVVCAAVEAAHRSLIVHRDLKPANVLVTGEGHVKLLDFGIAKLLDEVDEDDATRTGHQPFTPAYAAPEQRAGAPVTTATDVYALGVLLGELISGQRLNDGKGATPASYISGDEPDGMLPEPAAILRRRLRGDLGAIVQKALADSPERRYASAAGLADDVRRLLEERPVSAQKPTRWYRARRFVQRHRAGVGMAAAFVLALLGAFAAVVWQGNVARREAERAGSMRDLLLDVFRAAEPAGPRLAPPSVADVVEAAVGRLRKADGLRPDVRIELVAALGGVLGKQGRLQQAEELLEANQREAATLLPAAHPIRAEAGLAHAAVLVDAGRRGEARATMDALLAEWPRANGADLRARALTASVMLRTHELERERALVESAEALDTCAGGACRVPTHIAALIARGEAFSANYDDASAIAPLEAALASQRSLYEGPHVETANIQRLLGLALGRLGQGDRAEVAAREALAIVEASFPDPHYRRVEALSSLNLVLMDRYKMDEVLQLSQRLVAMRSATLGPDHPKVAFDYNNLGALRARVGDYAAAEREFRAALDIVEARHPGSMQATIYRGNLAGLLALRGDPAGMPMLRDVIAALRAQPEPSSDMICAMLEKLGRAAFVHGDAAGALAAYGDADAIYRDSAVNEKHRVYTRVGLGRALALAGRRHEAVEQLELALARMSYPPDGQVPVRVEARAALADLLREAGRAEEARPLALQATEEARRIGRLPSYVQDAVDRVGAPQRPAGQSE